MKYVHRTLEPVISRATNRFKAIMVSGMRQVGKSTMLLSFGSDRNYVTLDDLDAYSLATTARNIFFQQYPPPIFVDEIQRAPDLALQIKILVDTLNKPGLVWLTGSQRFEMMKNVAESLAGRLVSYELLPFSLYERQEKSFEQKPYLPHGLTRGTLTPKTRAETWEIVWQGAWPDVLTDSADERDDFFNSLLRTYIERDIVATGVRHLRTFEIFLSALASRIGQELHLNSLASSVGISLPTAKDWLSIAEASGIVYLLPAFSENIGRSTIKRPKLYFADTGFACWLCKIPSPEALDLVYNGGNLFENFVVIELLKSWVHNGKRPLFYYYRDTKFNEIDLLIRSGTQYFPIEIKATEHPRVDMVKAFNLIKGGKFEKGQGALICLSKTPRFLNSDVVAHSIWDI